MNRHQSEDCPSSVGMLFDETPRLTTAVVRPYVWANLLHRGATKPEEIVAALMPVCSKDDIKIANWDGVEEGEDRTWVEVCVQDVLGEMLLEGLCRYNEELDLWVLSVGENKKNVPKVISACTTLNAQMPKHFLSELAYCDRKKIQSL